MRIAVLLLQMGGPSSLDEVQSFLYNLFSDEYIIQLPSYLKPFQSQLADFISKRRSPKVQKLYAEIGGASPILFETQAQAKALAKYLNRESSPDEYLSYIAMRYSEPRLEETLQEIEKDSIDQLIVLPLYPQYSLATSGSSILEFRKLIAQSKLKAIPIRYIESWYDAADFIQLIVQRILTELEALESEGVSHPAKVHILFSAHGLPEAYIRAGDPYQAQILETVKLVMGRLPLYRYSLAYQSRVGPVKWLGPSTDKEIRRLAKERGERNLIVVPISFVGDHIETLSEINIEYKHYALEQGIERFRVTRLPKANPLLIKALAALVVQNTRNAVLKV